MLQALMSVLGCIWNIIHGCMSLGDIAIPNGQVLGGSGSVLSKFWNAITKQNTGIVGTPIVTYYNNSSAPSQSQGPSTSTGGGSQAVGGAKDAVGTNLVNFYYGLRDYMPIVEPAGNWPRGLAAELAKLLYLIDKFLQAFYTRFFGILDLDSAQDQGSRVTQILHDGQIAGFTVAMLMLCFYGIGALLSFNTNGFQELKDIIWSLCIGCFIGSALPILTHMASQGVSAFASSTLGTGYGEGANSEPASMADSLFWDNVYDVSHRVLLFPNQTIKVPDGNSIMYQPKSEFYVPNQGHYGDANSDASDDWQGSQGNSVGNGDQGGTGHGFFKNGGLGMTTSNAVSDAGHGVSQGIDDSISGTKIPDKAIDAKKVLINLAAMPPQEKDMWNGLLDENITNFLDAYGTDTDVLNKSGLSQLEDQIQGQSSSSNSNSSSNQSDQSGNKSNSQNQSKSTKNGSKKSSKSSKSMIAPLLSVAPNVHAESVGDRFSEAIHPQQQQAHALMHGWWNPTSANFLDRSLAHWNNHGGGDNPTKDDSDYYYKEHPHSHKPENAAAEQGGADYQNKHGIPAKCLGRGRQQTCGWNNRLNQKLPDNSQVFQYDIVGVGRTASIERMGAFGALGETVGAPLADSYGQYKVNWADIYLGLIILAIVLAGFIMKIVSTYFQALVMYGSAGLMMGRLVNSPSSIKYWIRSFFSLYEMAIFDILTLKFYFIGYEVIQAYSTSIMYNHFPVAPNTIILGLVQALLEIALMSAALDGVDAISHLLGQPTGAHDGWAKALLGLNAGRAAIGVGAGGIRMAGAGFGLAGKGFAKGKGALKNHHAMKGLASKFHGGKGKKGKKHGLLGHHGNYLNGGPDNTSADPNSKSLLHQHKRNRARNAKAAANQKKRMQGGQKGKFNKGHLHDNKGKGQQKGTNNGTGNNEDKQGLLKGRNSGSDNNNNDNDTSDNFDPKDTDANTDAKDNVNKVDPQTGKETHPYSGDSDNQVVGKDLPNSADQRSIDSANASGTGDPNTVKYSPVSSNPSDSNHNQHNPNTNHNKKHANSQPLVTGQKNGSKNKNNALLHSNGAQNNANNSTHQPQQSKKPNSNNGNNNSKSTKNTQTTTHSSSNTPTNNTNQQQQGTTQQTDEPQANTLQKVGAGVQHVGNGVSMAVGKGTQPVKFNGPVNSGSGITANNGGSHTTQTNHQVTHTNTVNHQNSTNTGNSQQNSNNPVTNSTNSPTQQSTQTPINSTAAPTTQQNAAQQATQPVTFNHQPTVNTPTTQSTQQPSPTNPQIPTGQSQQAPQGTNQTVQQPTVDKQVTSTTSRNNPVYNDQPTQTNSQPVFTENPTPANANNAIQAEQQAPIPTPPPVDHNNPVPPAGVNNITNTNNQATSNNPLNNKGGNHKQVEVQVHNHIHNHYIYRNRGTQSSILDSRKAKTKTPNFIKLAKEKKDNQ